MNVYEVITQRIMEQLERGTVPWQRPWNGAQGMPRNLLSQKAYRGINVWTLGSMGYSTPYWITYRQAQEIGGHVKKGEHGCPVVFWKWSNKGEESQDGEENTRQAPIARLYTVFNARQCELPERLASLLTIDTPSTEPPALLENCERIIANMPQRPNIRHGEARAYYRPSTDVVNMPERSLFPKAEHFTLSCSMNSPIARDTGAV